MLPSWLGSDLGELSLRERLGRVFFLKERQPERCGVKEKLSQRQWRLEFLLDAGRQLDGQERVPSEVKEVIVNADALRRKEVLPDFSERFLAVTFGRGVAGRGRLLLRFGKLFTVELPVWEAWDFLEFMPKRGNHSGRKSLAEVCAQITNDR